MLYTELKKGQSVDIGGAKVTIVDNRNSKVRLGIDADKSIKIKHERRGSSVQNLKQDA